MWEGVEVGWVYTASRANSAVIYLAQVDILPDDLRPAFFNLHPEEPF